ncbi:LysR family transcriptional regulator [Pseudacidovorax intermedius]|uniref:LysR family transcriptional regulator n=1 Tax=Pseudacidovorax intermedius TaxID=433924 RepID=A0A147GY51_9BURK|nr:LysR family transcriptional regulator [Pseudacidovorax intermedius]KTT22577.1 LysR family transcriptional regulator [Pseudacidovorax intermedius]
MIKNLDIRQLEAFAAVMSSGSITGAARLLARSQPAVTRLIHELEAATGYALFTRHGPRVAPTAEGFQLFEEVQQLLGDWRRLQQRVDEIGRGGAQPLVLAATSAAALGLVPAALQALEAGEGTGAVRLVSGSPERVMESVLGGAVQLGVSSLPLEHRGLQVLWIGEAPCVAVLPDGDPLAAHDVVPAAALAGRRLVTLSNPFRLRHRIDALLGGGAPEGEGGARGADVIDTNSSVNAQALVRAGLGIALLDPLTVHGVPMAGVQVRPLDVHIPFFFGAVVPQGRPVTRRVQALADALQRAAAQLPGFVAHPPEAHARLLQAAQGAGPSSSSSRP